MVAESIVMDHKKSIMLGYSPGEAEPGIDWVPGAFDVDSKGEKIEISQGKKLFAAQHAAVLEQMKRLQMNWYKVLVGLADDDWNRYHMHRFITKLQRTAATTLNLLNKEWMLETEIERALSRCKFCFTNIHPEAIICFSCHGDQRLDEYQNVAEVAAQK